MVVSSGTVRLLQSILLHGDRMLRPGSGSGAAAMSRQHSLSRRPVARHGCPRGGAKDRDIKREKERTEIACNTITDNVSG